MSEAGFTNCLKAILGEGMDVNESFDPDGISAVDTFEEAEVPTMNQGVVVTMDDGSQFQITVVRSR